MKNVFLPVIIIITMLTTSTGAQPSFRDAVLADAGLNFAEVFLTNIFSKKSLTKSIRNAAIAATATSVLHQSAWKLLDNPKYTLPAQMLFLKGNDIKMKMLRDKPLKSGALIRSWKLRYLFMEIDPLAQRVDFKPGLLAAPFATTIKGMFSRRAPAFNISQSLKTGTFFYGDYRSWHERQLIMGGRVIYGSY